MLICSCRFTYMMNSNIISRIINNTPRMYFRIPHAFITGANRFFFFFRFFLYIDAASIALANTAKQNIARESLYCRLLVDMECRDITTGAESLRGGNQRNQINPHTKKSMSNND